MGTIVAPKPDTKLALIQAGTDLMLEKGYTNTGIQDVLKALGIPKGSFYHYFDSKENFAVAIIHHFDETYSPDIRATLSNKEKPALQRLRDYCEQIKAGLAAQQCKKGCLIGNLSQEMADQSEVLRKELCDVMDKWRDMFAACIAEAQATGEIKSKHSAHDLAELFSAGWNGAVMRAKTRKNPESLDVFINLVFGGNLI